MSGEPIFNPTSSTLQSTLERQARIHDIEHSRKVRNATHTNRSVGSSGWSGRGSDYGVLRRPSGVGRIRDLAKRIARMRCESEPGGRVATGGSMGRGLKRRGSVCRVPVGGGDAVSGIQTWNEGARAALVHCRTICELLNAWCSGPSNLTHSDCCVFCQRSRAFRDRAASLIVRREDSVGKPRGLGGDLPWSPGISEWGIKAEPGSGNAPRLVYWALATGSESV